MISLNLEIILLFIIPIWLISRGRYYLKRRNLFNWYREFIMNVFFIYLIVVGYLTMQPFDFTLPIIGVRTFTFDTNLFYNLRNMASSHIWYKILYSVGNIALFVPFGILFPMLYKRTRNIFHITLLGFLLSLGIELTQAFFTLSRTGTVDDLFFNTLGAFIGYLWFFVILLLGGRFRMINRFLS